MHLWCVVAALLPAVSALYQLSLDKDSYDASSDSMKVSWSTSGKKQLLKQLTNGNFKLCTYNSNDDFDCSIWLEKNVDLSKESSLTVSLSSISSQGPSGYWTVQLNAADPSNANEFMITYNTGWAKISGMTGSGTASQGSILDDTYNNVNTASSISWSSYTLPQTYATMSSYDIPYTWQKGPTRVAPFQRTPGTKVTMKTTPTNRAATSYYTPFKTYSKVKTMPLTTLTPSPKSTAIQWPNFDSALPNAPSGRRPTRVLPTLIEQRKRKRWVD